MSGASTTAMMTALLRGVHARRDPAPLLDDALGERLIDAAERGALLEQLLQMLPPDVHARLRALPPAEALDAAATANPAYGGVVVRSRWTEDRLLAAIARGVRRYVLLASGLDSFAFRRPPAAADLEVIEIDTAPTLAWKRERAAAVGLDGGGRVRMIAADLDAGAGAALAQVPGITATPSVVACLGLLPYLETTAIPRLLGSIAASVAPGSELIFDFVDLGGAAADRDLARVRGALAAGGGETWQGGLAPATLGAQLAALGLTLVEHLDGAALEGAYGRGRVLRVPHAMHLCRALVATRE